MLLNNYLIHGIVLILLAGTNTGDNQWQSLIPRLLRTYIMADMSSQKSLQEAMYLLMSIGTQICYQVCDQPRSNLWYATDPLLFKGYCGELLLTQDLHSFDNETGFQLGFTLKPAAGYGINVTFDKFNLPTSEGICDSQIMTVTVQNKGDIHCGHMLPWFRVSDKEIYMSYTAHKSARRYTKQDYNKLLFFHMKYSIINSKNSVGIHEIFTFNIHDATYN